MDVTDEVHFDGWTLHRRAGELVRDGARTRLQGQPLRVLEALLECPGEVVTREQLIARLWPSGVVDYDTALNSAVRRLRTALDDHAETPRYIETLPRRGYRFVGQLEPPAVTRIHGALQAPVPPAQTERPASRRGSRWPLAAAAALALFAVFVALTRSADSPGAPVAAAEAPADARVEELYTRARFLFQRRAPGDVGRAREHFEKALRLDPNHARAWAGLAGTHWIDTVEGRVAPEAGLAKLRDAAERAQALDPQLAEAQLRLANYRWAVGDRAGQKVHLEEALRLEPDSPAVLSTLASLAAGEGRLDEAVDLQRRAVSASPLSQVDRYNLASILYLAGRLDEAMAEMLSLRELHPAMTRNGDLLGFILVLEGDYGEALAVADALSDEADRLEIRAMALHALGRDAESDAALGALAQVSRSEPLRMAAVHAFRGERDAAFDWLEAASVLAGSKPWISRSRRVIWLAPFSPMFEPLHVDPRWRAWVESIALDSRPVRVSGARRAPGREGNIE